MVHCEAADSCRSGNLPACSCSEESYSVRLMVRANGAKRRQGVIHFGGVGIQFAGTQFLAVPDAPSRPLLPKVFIKRVINGKFLLQTLMITPVCAKPCAIARKPRLSNAICSCPLLSAPLTIRASRCSVGCLIACSSRIASNVQRSSRWFSFISGKRFASKGIAPSLRASRLELFF